MNRNALNEKRKTSRQVRDSKVSFTARDNENGMNIECYFSVFNSIYEIFPGVTEEIIAGAFDLERDNDVRALIDHVTRLVLGRTVADTLKLSIDDKGLRGIITINPDDQDALNLYARVKRGDVNQCSFGFDILDEEIEYREDGAVHYKVKSVKLYEVSIVTFPAYEETSAEARHLAEKQKKHRAKQSKIALAKNKLEAIKNG